MTGDTIYALATGRPPAAIAVVRVSGPLAHQAGRLLAGGLPPPRQAALRRLRHVHGDDKIDDVLLIRFDAPASHTGEDVVEFQCHGGRAVVDAVMAALAGIEGLRLAEPGEFTRRAFEHGRIDLTEAEGLADLIEAETESQRRAALAMAEGGLRRQVEQWRELLLDLSARAEAAIDYADESDVDGDPLLSEGAAALAAELGEWLDRPRIEPLRDGVRVVLAGPPNSGKSSLLNAIAGSEKAIVTDTPGTTRDQIEVPLAVAGIPLLLTDTAGLRESADPVERIGIERTARAMAAADILLWLGEPGEAPRHPRLMRVHARCDVPGRGSAPTGSLAVSAHHGTGLRELLDRVAELAGTLLPGEGALALNRRQAGLLAEAYDALQGVERTGEIALIAEQLRFARNAFDRLTGRAGIDDVLDSIFGRFCLGK